jgi:hypothetical protein
MRSDAVSTEPLPVDRVAGFAAGVVYQMFPAPGV